MRLTVLLNIFISTLLCQERLDMLIKEVLSGSNDSAAIYLPMLEEQYPYNPNMLFLKGLMQTNGEEAMQIFVELYNNHPTSEYGDDAVMKVAEYYYASGMYIQSSEWLKKMPLYYSRSEHIERAIKLFLNSLIVSGHRDTAIFYSRVFNKQFPSLDVGGKINALIEDFKNSKKSSKDTTKLISHNNQGVLKPSTSLLAKDMELDTRSGNYSLQSGAYSIQKNAEKQKTYLMSEGFNSHIIELYQQRKILYAVRVGKYNTLKEAEEVSNQIKSLLDLKTIVVKDQ